MSGRRAPSGGFSPLALEVCPNGAGGGTPLPRSAGDHGAGRSLARRATHGPVAAPGIARQMSGTAIIEIKRIASATDGHELIDGEAPTIRENQTHIDGPSTQMTHRMPISHSDEPALDLSARLTIIPPRIMPALSHAHRPPKATDNKRPGQQCRPAPNNSHPCSYTPHSPARLIVFVAPAACPGYSGSRAPLHLGRRGGRRLGGCHRHTGRGPRRIERNGASPVSART